MTLSKSNLKLNTLYGVSGGYATLLYYFVEVDNGDMKYFVGSTEDGANTRHVSAEHRSWKPLHNCFRIYDKELENSFISAMLFYLNRVVENSLNNKQVASALFSTPIFLRKKIITRIFS